jgi:glycolate oxidase
VNATQPTVDPRALLTIAPATMTCAQLGESLALHRLCFPPDPLDRTTTLSELLARNGGGRRRLRYGRLSSYLRGLTIRTPAGAELALGGITVKNVTGYALPALLAGAEGGFGEPTSLTLTLRPLPQARRAWLLRFPSLEAASACADALLRARAQPNCLALLDRSAQELVATDLPLDSRAEAWLLVELDGHPTSITRQLTQLDAVARAQGGRLELDAADDAALAACWRPWEALAARQRAGQGALWLDLSLPREQVVAFTKRTHAIATAYRLRLALWGDLGLGAMHAALIHQAGGERAEEARTAALLIWRAALALGGAEGGEYGNPAIADALARAADPQRAALIGRLRAAFGG